MKFNAESFLDDAGIPYRSKGVNVPKDAVNICCIYCGERRYHLVIRKRKKYCNCWVCKNYISVVQIVKDILNCSWKDAQKIVYGDKHVLFDADEETHVGGRERAEICRLPKGISPLMKTTSDDLWLNAVKYAVDRLRAKDWAECIDRHNLHYGYSGEQAYRIVVPMYFGGRLMTYTGRDFTNRSPIKYKTCKKENSVMLPTEILYGLDTFTGYRAIIVEGPFDKLVMGEQALAASTNKLSARQKTILCNLDLEELIFVMDPDAIDMAEELATYFRPVIDRIKIVRLEKEKDPADLGYAAVIKQIEKTKWFDF